MWYPYLQSALYSCTALLILIIVCIVFRHELVRLSGAVVRLLSRESRTLQQDYTEGKQDGEEDGKSF